MSVPSGPHQEEFKRSVAGSTRVYRKLTRVYPTELREEHAEEMVGCFRDLCLRELQGRGRRGLALLWFRTLVELSITALKERSAAMAGNAYLPVAPITAAKWGAISALSGGILGIAYDLIMNLFPVGIRTWTVPSLHFLLPISFATLLSILGLFGIYGTLSARSERASAVPDRLAAAGAVLAAVSLATISIGFFMRLGAYAGAEAPSMSPDALNWGSWWYRELQWVLHLTGLLSWVIGLSLLGVAAFRKRMLGSMRVVPLAVVVLLLGQQVHDDFTHILTYSLPFLGSAILGWALLKNNGDASNSEDDDGSYMGRPGSRTPGRRFLTPSE